MKNIFEESIFIKNAKDSIEDQFDAYNKAISAINPILETSKDEEGKTFEAFEATMATASKLRENSREMIGYLNQCMQSNNFPKNEEMQGSIDLVNTDSSALDELDEYKVLNSDDKLKYKFICVNLEQASKMLDSALKVLETVIKILRKILKDEENK